MVSGPSTLTEERSITGLQDCINTHEQSSESLVSETRKREGVGAPLVTTTM